MKAMKRDTSEVLESMSGMAVRVRICTPIITEQSLKYNGKSLLCNVPNTLLGKFLNMIIPVTNVVYTIVPNHVENDSKCTVAAMLGGRMRYFPNLCNVGAVAEEL